MTVANTFIFSRASQFVNIVKNQATNDELVIR